MWLCAVYAGWFPFWTLTMVVCGRDTGELQTILAKVKYMGLDDAQPDPNIKQRFCGMLHTHTACCRPM